jgi:hypothetical protein
MMESIRRTDVLDLADILGGAFPQAVNSSARWALMERAKKKQTFGSTKPLPHPAGTGAIAAKPVTFQSCGGKEISGFDMLLWLGQSRASGLLTFSTKGFRGGIPGYTLRLWIHKGNIVRVAAGETALPSVAAPPVPAFLFMEGVHLTLEPLPDMDEAAFDFSVSAADVALQLAIARDRGAVPSLEDAFGEMNEPVNQKRGYHYFELEGETTIHRVVLGQRHIVVGRSPEHCDLVISDPTVSAVHAQVTLMRKAIWVEDLGSSNGTWFNDLAVLVGVATLDTVVRFGNYRMRLCWQKVQGH